MEFDTVIAHYSTSELLELLGITRPTRRAILEATTEFAQKYEDKPDLVRFSKDAQNVLLDAFAEPKRTMTRLITVDSYYRDTTDVSTPTDSFSFTLSETLSGVISISLFSVEIPFSWYTFAAAKGTTSLNIRTLNYSGDRATIPVSIADGNYTSMALLTAVTDAINIGLITLGFPVSPTITFVISPVTACVTVRIIGMDAPLKLEWFDPTHQTPILTPTRVNKSLGWNLGFRADSTTLNYPNASATAPSLLTVNPSKSIFMHIDDHAPFCRFSSGIITLGYITPNRAVVDSTQMETTYRVGQGKNRHTQITAPRNLTAKQILSSNAVADSTLNYSRMRDTPVDSNLFAKIPLKKPGEWLYHQAEEIHSHDDGPAKTIVEISGPLQLNSRDYFGTVTLKTLSVSLLDDRGNVIGLNGMDWSFTLLVKQERTQT